MTFEKHNSLDEYINKGVKINAPVCQELLTTIFYDGTTLHGEAEDFEGVENAFNVILKLEKLYGVAVAEKFASLFVI